MAHSQLSDTATMVGSYLVATGSVLGPHGRRPTPGTPLVVVHSGPRGFIYDFEQLTGPTLGQLGPVVHYEQREPGHSDQPPYSQYSTPLLVNDLEQLLCHLDLPRLALPGISSGGDLAAEYTVAHPEQVTKLILHGTPLADPLTPSTSRPASRQSQSPTRYAPRSGPQMISRGRGPSGMSSIENLRVRTPHQSKWRSMPTQYSCTTPRPPLISQSYEWQSVDTTGRSRNGAPPATLSLRRTSHRVEPRTSQAVYARLCRRAGGLVARPTVNAIVATLRRSTRSELVARYYRRIAAVPIALAFGWFGGFIVVGIAIFVALGTIGADKDAFIDRHAGHIGLLIGGAVIVAMVTARRRLMLAADETTEPTYPRPARSDWPGRARDVAIFYVFMGQVALWIGVLIIVGIIAIVASRLFGVDEMSNLVWILPISVLTLPLAVWSYQLGRNTHLAQLEAATPPALQRAHRLRDLAQALEDAMHEATLMADDLQTAIDTEKSMVAELLKQSAEARRIADIESDQLNALLAHQERRQHRSTIRERWINIVVAVLGLIVGYLLNLVSPAFFTGLFDR